MATIEVDTQGNIHIPEKFGIKPRDKVIVTKVADAIVIRKPKKETAAEIKRMTEEMFKEVNWESIEKEREDREWL